MLRRGRLVYKSGGNGLQKREKGVHSNISAKGGMT